MTRHDRQPRQRLDPDSRREAILSAAAPAFSSAPYDEVKIASISKLAGASDALLYRYFTNKEGLYCAALQTALESLGQHHRTVVANLPAGVSIRDRVQLLILVHLEHLAQPHSLLPHGPVRAEPRAATTLRSENQAEMIDLLRDQLAPSAQDRHEFALRGFIGFLDAAGDHWVSKGCPEDMRWPLIEAALGSLQGALGDWAA